jgi:hypothetical protein
VSSILTIRSGQWLNIVTGVDNALNGQLQQRPNKVSDDVYGPKTINNFLNRAAFASPAPGTFGNLEYRGVEGPGYGAVDMALSRLIGLGTTRTLELRIEAFNVTNRFNWGVAPGNPAFTNLNSSQFGRIVQHGGTPRILQFGIKYGF